MSAKSHAAQFWRRMDFPVFAVPSLGVLNQGSLVFFFNPLKLRVPAAKPFQHVFGTLKDQVLEVVEARIIQIDASVNPINVWYGVYKDEGCVKTEVS